MNRRTSFLLGIAAVSAVAVSIATVPAFSAGSRRGGVLNAMLREDLPQGFAIHETATISTVWPAMPCFNNLVTFDPSKKTERMDTVVGELAERWAWQDNYRNLVFFLRKGVKWHDGEPFTANDVKFTFDMVRGAAGADGRLRLNPRKDWYSNVEAIEAPDAHTVVFRLKRPQPSLVMMLASGYSPVYPAHVAPAEFRTGCVGTGPYRLKEWRRGQFVEYVRNPDYFIPGRPYLDGIRYVVISERGARTAALQAGRLDVAFPGEGTKAMWEQLHQAEPRLVVDITPTNVNDNLIMNIGRPPFSDVRLRRAISLAVDRDAYVKAVAQGGGVVGASMLPKPYGVWGLLAADLKALPGYGRGASDKASARRLLSELGYGPSRPLTVEMATRAIALYVDFASFVVSELKAVGVQATLKQVETAQWHPLVTRRDYQLGANLTGIGIDDPDANFFENYACQSPRNYTDYCDEQTMRLVEQQSQELDPKKRLALVRQIQQRLEQDVARPVMGWRLDYNVRWPHVHDFVPHQSIYNYGRLQDVWMDERAG